MDEEYNDSVDTSTDMDVSDVDVLDDILADILDDIPEDDYSDADVVDDLSEDVPEETFDDDVEYDATDESVEDDSIESDTEEFDEPIDDIEEDTFEEPEEVSDDYVEPDDIFEDTDAFDEDMEDGDDETEDIPEDTSNTEIADQDEAFEEDIPEDVVDTEITDETSDIEETDTTEQSEDVSDAEATDEIIDIEDIDATEQPEDVADTEVADETTDVEDTDTFERPEDMNDAETQEEASDVEDSDTSERPEDTTDTETTDETIDVEDTNVAEQPENVSDTDVADHRDLETCDYETSPEAKDVVNPETFGEYVSADNPFSEIGEGFTDEFSDGKDESDERDLSKDVLFSGEEQSDTDVNTEDSDATSSISASVAADVDDSSGTSEINSISEYMNAHNYRSDDFATYSQDPQWRQLMRQEYPDYELPEMTQESARAQLSQYINDHNYRMEDYAEYSQDPVWRELHLTAFPDDEIPPLAEEKEAAELTNYNDNELSDVQQTMQEENDDVSISSTEVSAIDAGDETGEESITEYPEYKKSFFSKNNIERDYETYNISDAENLSDEERRVLQDYTSENPKCSYSNINRSLYDPEFKAASEQEKNMLEKEINVLTDCLDNKELPRQAELYRGIKSASDIFGEDVDIMSPEEIIEKYTGTEYINPAFTSTSCSRDVAQKFANGAWDKDSGLLIIKAPKGTKGMCVGDISSFGSSEGEILLQRGTIYRLDKIAYENGRYNITMTARGNAR